MNRHPITPAYERYPDATATDDSLMSFGLHRGKKLREVPARYLRWLGEQSWITQHPALHAYLVRRGLASDPAPGAHAPPRVGAGAPAADPNRDGVIKFAGGGGAFICRKQ